MASINKFPGLPDGPITHSAVDNLIANAAIGMGDCLILVTGPFESGENIPRVIRSFTAGSQVSYGIAVGGDVDGHYGSGSDADATTLEFQATTTPGQGVKVVTRGNCLARVSGGANGVEIADKLSPSFNGQLKKGLTSEDIIAVALNTVAIGDLDMIPVEVVKEGLVV